MNLSFDANSSSESHGSNQKLDIRDRMIENESVLYSRDQCTIFWIIFYYVKFSAKKSNRPTFITYR